jgi:hypothetical protein
MSKEIRDGIATAKEQIAQATKRIEIAKAEIYLWQTRCEHTEPPGVGRRPQFCIVCGKKMYNSTD